jgi:hypothetical protein
MRGRGFVAYDEPEPTRTVSPVMVPGAPQQLAGGSPVSDTAGFPEIVQPNRPPDRPELPLLVASELQPQVRIGQT